MTKRDIPKKLWPTCVSGDEGILILAVASAFSARVLNTSAPWIEASHTILQIMADKERFNVTIIKSKPRDPHDFNTILDGEML
jgi:hypothetical protein